MTREELEKAIRLVPIAVDDIPGVPGIYLRPWAMSERAALVEWRRAHVGYDDLCAKLFALSVCGPDGVRMFKDDADDLALIRTVFDGVAVESVAQRVIDMNGLNNSPKA